MTGNGLVAGLKGKNDRRKEKERHHRGKEKSDLYEKGRRRVRWPNVNMRGKREIKKKDREK